MICVLLRSFFNIMFLLHRYIMVTLPILTITLNVFDRFTIFCSNMQQNMDCSSKEAVDLLMGLVLVYQHLCVFCLHSKHHLSCILQATCSLYFYACSACRDIWIYIQTHPQCIFWLFGRCASTPFVIKYLRCTVNGNKTQDFSN